MANKDKIQKLEEFFQKYKEGEKPSEKDYNLFLETLGEAENDPELGSLFSDYSADMDQLLNDPNLINHAKKQQKTENISNAVQMGVNILSSLNGLSVGNKQIKQSQDALSKLKKPNISSLRLNSPLRKQQITNSLRDINSIDQYIAPAREGIFDQYTKDINTAKTASTGQAGDFGSLAQVASLRRNAALRQLIPLGLQGRAQAQGRLDSLIDSEQLDKYREYSGNLNKYNIDLGQYNLEAEAAGQLGQTGNINKYNSINGILGQLPSMVGPIASMIGGGGGASKSSGLESFMGSDYGNVQVTGLGTDIDSYLSDLNYNLANNYTGRRSN